MELKDVKNSKQLEQYWIEKNVLSKEKVDIEKDLPLEEECFAKTFFDKKTIVYIESETNEGYVTYLDEMPMACGQGETKATALVDLYNIIKVVIEYERDYCKWVDVILTYENNKAEKDFAEIISMLQSKYNISQDDIFI